MNMAGSPDGLEAVIRIPKASETKAKIILLIKKPNYSVLVEDSDGVNIADNNTSLPYTALLYNTGSEWRGTFL